MSTQIEIQGKRIGRFRASVLLSKETFRFLSMDKEMLVAPLVGFFFGLALLGVLVLILFATGTMGALTKETFSSLSQPEVIALFLSYVASAYVVAWTQAVIAHIVATRARGGNATLGNGMSVAFSHTADLLLWSVITSTVGIILRFLSERSQLLGRIVAGLLGAAWAILTYFAVPSMVIGKRSALEAIKDSAVVFKKTWGETLITNVSFSLVFLLVFLLFSLGLIGIGFLGGWTFGLVLTLIVLFVCGTFLLSLLSSVMGSVLRTLLYMYASEGTVPENFNRDLLEQIMVRRAGVPSGVAPGTGTSFV